MTRAAALAVAAAGAAVAAAALPAPARAGSAPLADFDVQFTSTAPGAPTGFATHVFLRREGDPEAKPSPLRKAVLRFPGGTQFDTGAAPQCTASDAELKARGPDACDPRSKLALGTLVGITGFGPPADPLVGDDHVFNGPNQLIEVITRQGSSASPAFDRVRIDGTTLTALPPPTPGGPPEGEIAIRSIDFAIPVTTSGERSLVRTPPACPDGVWVTVATFYFADGNEETVASTTPCDPPPQKRPRLSLQLTPRSVAAGERTRFRLRVKSADPRCARGATVRLGGRTMRTDRRGRAAITTRFRRPGLHYARASHPGCRSTRAALRVTRAST